MKPILLALLAICAMGQTVVNVPALTFSPEAVAAFDKWLPTQFSGTMTTLAVTLDASSTIVTVASTAGIGALSALRIDDEVVIASAKTPTTLTVLRGQMGTIVVAHVVPVTGTAPVVKELMWKTMAQWARAQIIAGVGGVMDATGATQAPDDVLAVAMRKAATDKAALKASAVQ